MNEKALQFFSDIAKKENITQMDVKLSKKMILQNMIQILF